MKLENKRWSDDEFFAERRKVLSLWPTGKEVDVDEAIEYHKRLPEDKVYAKKLAKARREGKSLILLGLGKPRIEDDINELQVLSPYADLFDPFVDTYTRESMYAKAQEAVQRSYQTGENLLNGYPYVYYGVKNTRRLVEASQAALNVSSNGEDPRLIEEIGMAAGITAALLHDVRELIAHAKNYPLEQRIRNNQYCCRLAAYYTERGAPICKLATGSNLPFCPPGMGIALVVLESLTAAEQGVKYLVSSHDQRGELIQDVASLRTMPKMMSKYLNRFGYKNVSIFRRSGPGALAWPLDKDASGAQVALCTVTAVLAGVEIIRTKSTEEGRGIPSIESQIAAASIARHVVNVLGKHPLPDSDELREEERMLELEAEAIVNKVIELGDGDIAVGEMKAVEHGVIDVPFSPWIKIRGGVLPVRDRAGAVRYLDPGNMPLPKEVIEYHRGKIAEREKAEKRKAGVEMLIDDLRFRARPVTVAAR